MAKRLAYYLYLLSAYSKQPDMQPGLNLGGGNGLTPHLPISSQIPSPNGTAHTEKKANPATEQCLPHPVPIHPLLPLRPLSVLPSFLA